MRTIFIGDIHGCANELDALLDKLGFRYELDRLLLTGDAFSRGPDPHRVWDRIQQTRAEMVLGNHDDTLIRHLHADRAGRRPRYRQRHHATTMNCIRPVAHELLLWLEQRPLWIENTSYLLVHAGIDPSRGLNGTSREQFLSIREWPLSHPKKTLWHEHYEPMEKLLIFGHDARGGLVERRRDDGRLYLLGLDTGCVHGGQLTAYVLEEDHLVQIPSQVDPRTWRE